MPWISQNRRLNPLQPSDTPTSCWKFSESPWNGFEYPLKPLESLCTAPESLWESTVSPFKPPETLGTTSKTSSISSGTPERPGVFRDNWRDCKNFSTNFRGFLRTLRSLETVCHSEMFRNACETSPKFPETTWNNLKSPWSTPMPLNAPENSWNSLLLQTPKTSWKPLLNTCQTPLEVKPVFVKFLHNLM